MAARRAAFVAALYASAQVGAAVAADGDGRYAVDGAGRTACSNFIAARAAAADGEAAAGAYRVYAGWIEGYVTAFNHFQSDTFDLTPWQTVELLGAKLAQFCEGQPETQFNDALNLLAQSLYGDRLKEASPVVQLRASGQAVAMYKAMLPRLHAALVAADTDPGPATDQFTPAMAAALKAYQEAEGLPVSGLPDQPTLNNLFP